MTEVPPPPSHLTLSTTVHPTKSSPTPPQTTSTKRPTVPTLHPSLHHHHSSISPNRLFIRPDSNFTMPSWRGCQAHHGKAEAAPHSKCDENEANRIEMNVRQPTGMWNYTNMGFRLVKLPPRMVKTLTKFWKDNKGKEVEEAWFEGNTYTNH